MQPIIGITMCFDDSDLIKPGVEYNYVRREYGLAVQKAGGQPLFLDPTINPLVAAKLCDGIVISGGEDIDPALYNQSIAGTNQQEPRTRTDWERQLIDACDEWNRPILGICYGEQLLNVHYGGTLYQDIASDHENHVDHGTSRVAAYHEITFEQGFLGYQRGERAVVAARHHQAVHELAPGFSVVARSGDGTIEAIAGRGHVGVQWHAESDDTAHKIYGEFVKNCSTRSQPAKAVRRTIRSKAISQVLAVLSAKK
jgi:putative glutamine amidotransferase